MTNLNDDPAQAARIWAACFRGWDFKIVPDLYSEGVLYAAEWFYQDQMHNVKPTPRLDVLLAQIDAYELKAYEGELEKYNDCIAETKEKIAELKAETANHPTVQQLVEKDANDGN